MFVSSFKLKTRIQWALVTLQDYLDFPILHPAREMKRIALRQSVQYARKHMASSVGMESAREVLAHALQLVTVKGHCLEFGVYKGGSIRFIANTVGAATIVHGFDCFTGLPEDWSGGTDSFDAGGRLPKVPKNVVLHPGLFADTLPGWVAQNPGQIAFLHVDCDLYSSAKCILDNIEDRIVPGTIIVFDDYFNFPNWKEHEFRAFRELIERRHVQYEYLAYARFQAAVRITAIDKPSSIDDSAGDISAIGTAVSNGGALAAETAKAATAAV